MKKAKIGPQYSDERVEAKITDPASVSSSFKDLGGSLMKDLWDELLTGSVKTVPEQLFSADQKNPQSSQSIELRKNEEISLKKKETNIQLKSEQHQEYFNEVKYTETKRIRDDQRFIEKRIEEILIELKKLTKTSKEMQILFKEVTIEEVPVQAGTYHINFFEWVLSVVKNARMKVEEGANWLQMFSSKKKQRQYWSMFKKHGTTFGLSQERTMATQTG